MDYKMYIPIMEHMPGPVQYILQNEGPKDIWTQLCFFYLITAIDSLKKYVPQVMLIITLFVWEPK